VRNEGHTDSDAIRVALHEAAELRRRKSVLRLEAEAAAVDLRVPRDTLRLRAAGRPPCRRRPGRRAARALYGAGLAHVDDAAPRSCRPTIDLQGSSTYVLIEQTTAISPDRLGESVGRLSASEQRDLDTALALVFGL
jgi:hypothetical protein